MQAKAVFFCHFSTQITKKEKKPTGIYKKIGILPIFFERIF